MIMFRDAPPTLVTPNVVRMTAAAAEAALNAAGLVPVFITSGHALADPPPGATVQVQVPSVGQLTNPGAGIALYLS